MSKENKERKEKALAILDCGIKSAAGLTTEDMQRIRNLIDPPISELSRAEVETELSSLRERVAHLENMEEYASMLKNDLDSIRREMRMFHDRLRYCHEQGFDVRDIAKDVAVQMDLFLKGKKS